MRRPVLKSIAWGTLVAGTLDISGAIIDGALEGKRLLGAPQAVAAGLFGPAMYKGGLPTALLGLAVHFAIMAVMATVWVLALSRVRVLRAHAVAAGLLYGVGLYLVMYWVVLPLRWPTIFPQTDPKGIALALFFHCICVGLPLALIARRFLGKGR